MDAETGETTKLEKLPPHPLRRVALVIGAIGVALIALSAIASGATPLPIAAGVFAIVFALWIARTGEAVQIVNRALRAITEGRNDEARAWLDLGEKRFRSPYVLRVVDLHRAAMAWNEGDLVTARARLESALRRRLTLTHRFYQRLHVGTAHGLLSMVLAAAGDEAGSEREISMLRASDDAPPDALARAEIAHAIVLLRRGDRDALGHHLDGDAALLIENAPPRERAIVRAYRRMLRTSSTSVYRRPVPRDVESSARTKMTDWLARVAPDAAAHAERVLPDGTSSAIESTDRELDPEAVRAVAASRAAKQAAVTGGRKKTPSVRKVLILWAVLIAMFVSVWQIISDGPRGPAPTPPPTTSGPSLWSICCAVFFAVFGVLFFVQLRRAWQRQRTTLQARIAAARGKFDEAERLYRSVTEGKGVLGAHGFLGLALIAERRGNVADALMLCDLGIAKVSSGLQRAAASDLLLPELIAERAFVLAALDRNAEADVELASLRKEFPAYPLLARSDLRVRLLSRVRAGDLAGAAELARGRSPEMPLFMRDELLGDAAIASLDTSDSAEEERARVRDEVHATRDVEAWIQAVAPRALAALR